MQIDVVRHAVVESGLTTMLGLLLFVVVYVLLEKLSPISLRRELVERRNPAVAVVLFSVLVGLGIIVTAALRPSS